MASAERFSIDPETVPLDWHEAVAIVQEIATRAIGGEEMLVRRARDLSLDADGNLIGTSAGPGVIAHGALKASRDAQRLADLRSLLRDLLPPTAIPAPLQALADPTAAGVASLEEFSKALSFFERPGRGRDLKVVAGRHMAVREQAALDEKLAALTRKTRHEETTAPSAPPAPPVPQVTPPQQSDQPGWEFLSEAELLQPEAAANAKRKTQFSIEPWLPALKVAALATAATMLLVATVVGAYQLLARASGEAPAAAVPSVTQPERAVATSAPSAQAGRRAAAAQPIRAVDATQNARPSVAAPPRSSVRDLAVAAVAPLPVPRRTVQVARAENPTPPAAAPVITIPSFLDLARRSPGAGEVRTFLSSGRLEMPPVSFDTIYDGGDGQVRPARLVRPQLPEIPPNTPPEVLGIFEFIVNMRGSVERIRLVRSPVDRQYRDIMLMPAAKAWLFEPATKDGQPVRYRLQIHLPQ